jgi:hypothetical protein
VAAFPSHTHTAAKKVEDFALKSTGNGVQAPNAAHETNPPPEKEKGLECF